ncbi:bifunctional methylenetetrahydrofolate dehydrogenase/cyclohydrolase, mitochondrial-like [Patiria miniata]|uniref:methenyltetrahydrofolate cyclohydrolase n=1 Tax=Patiria miniata TaxID=46514 RepID=A0A914A866_PATMI|nr:bifunctional methylenetetrahydrofolate dehydrogenase/cyclohydrolase, mitochondrial-like [Patiria miniata]
MSVFRPCLRSFLSKKNAFGSLSASAFHRTSVNHAEIIDGKKISKEVQAEVAEEVKAWVAKGHRPPHLTAVLVGEDPASAVYVRNKMKAAQECGITSETIREPDTMTEAALLSLVDDLNKSDAVDGILVQLPVPPHMDKRKICDAVSPNKDVDGFNMVNVGRLVLDLPTLLPATPYGVWELIKRSGVETVGKNAVVMGRSKNVGLPLALLLAADQRNTLKMGLNCNVTICHSKTSPEMMRYYMTNADIIVAAAGRPRMITADMVKEGAAIFDVGINRVQDPKTGKYRLVGDVDYDGVFDKVGHITPVPGGVGPMTVAMLMKNTLQVAKGEI